MKNISKTITLITLISCSSFLVACGSGGSGSGGSPNSDVQSANGYSILNGSRIDFSYTATGCAGIQIGNSCSVALTYQTSGGSLYNGSLAMGTYDNSSYLRTYGFTSTIATCPNASVTQQSCNFTITATESANVSTVQSAVLMAGGTSLSSGFTSFQVGGGV